METIHISLWATRTRLTPMVLFHSIPDQTVTNAMSDKNSQEGRESKPKDHFESPFTRIELATAIADVDHELLERHLPEAEYEQEAVPEHARRSLCPERLQLEHDRPVRRQGRRERWVPSSWPTTCTTASGGKDSTRSTWRPFPTSARPRSSLGRSAPRWRCGPTTKPPPVVGGRHGIRRDCRRVRNSRATHSRIADGTVLSPIARTPVPSWMLPVPIQQPRRTARSQPHRDRLCL